MKLISKLALLVFSCFLLNTYVKVSAFSPEEDVVVYKETECNEKIDLHIVVDSSGSIGHYYWFKKVAPLVENIIKTVNIGRDTVNVSLKSFASYVVDYIAYGSKASIDKKLALDQAHKLKSDYLQGGTYLHVPIWNIVNDYILAAKVRLEAPQIILILTDGAPSLRNQAAEAVEYAKHVGAQVVILGIGQNNDTMYNRKLVGCFDNAKPCPNYVEASWDNVEKVMSRFLTKICHEVEKQAQCGEWMWDECSATCGKGVKYGFRKPLHPGCKAEIEIPCELPACVYPEEEKAKETIVNPPSPVLPPKKKKKALKPKKNQSGAGEKDINDDKTSDSDNNGPENIDILDDDKSNKKDVPADIIDSDGSDKSDIIDGSVVDNSDDGSAKSEEKREEEKEEEKEAKQEEENSKLINDVVKQEIEDTPSLTPSEADNAKDNAFVAPSVVVPGANIPQAEDHSDKDFSHEHSQQYDEKKFEDKKEKKGKSSANGYKIAGGVLGGAALLGVAFGGYKFLSATSASAIQSEGVPFNDVPADGKEFFEDQEQFKLPDENEWN